MVNPLDSLRIVVVRPAKYHTFTWTNSKNAGRVTDCGKIVTEQWSESTNEYASFIVLRPLVSPPALEGRS